MSTVLYPSNIIPYACTHIIHMCYFSMCYGTLAKALAFAFLQLCVFLPGSFMHALASSSAWPKLSMRCVPHVAIYGFQIPVVWKVEGILSVLRLKAAMRPVLPSSAPRLGGSSSCCCNKGAARRHVPHSVRSRPLWFQSCPLSPFEAGVHVARDCLPLCSPLLGAFEAVMGPVPHSAPIQVGDKTPVDKTGSVLPPAGNSDDRSGNSSNSQTG